MGKGKSKGKMLWSVVGFFAGGAFSMFGKGLSFIERGLYGMSIASTMWTATHKQDMPSYDSEGVQRFDKVMNTMSSTAVIPVIYGECKWGGNQTYHKTNPELNVLRKHVVFCEGGIEGIQSVSANDLLIPTTPQAAGTVFTVQNIKHTDATVKIGSKWLTLYANGKTTNVYLANKDDAERSDLYDYNTSISSLVSYINRLGDGWQAYPYASTNKYPGDLYGLYSETAHTDKSAGCGYYHSLNHSQYYCPIVENAEYKYYSKLSNKWVTIQRSPCLLNGKATPYNHNGNRFQANKEKYCPRLKTARSAVACYNNPIAAQTSTAKGNTYFTFHDGDCPDTYEETGSYKHCAWIDLNLAVSDELNGNPNITAIIRGKKVYDSRTGITAYSTNPAMCLRDLILAKRYGLGRWIKQWNIDENSFIEAANYCDEIINYEGVDGTIVKAKRYELNMLLDSQKNAIDWISDILANFCAYLVISNGKLALRIEKATSISHVFTDSNIVQGSLSISQLSIDETPNRYEITYVDPFNNWSSVKILVEDFADQKKRQKIISKKVELSGVKSQNQASRLGRFYRDYNASCSIQVVFSTAMQAMHLEPGDVITIGYHSVLNGLPIRITEIKETNKGTFEISGRQYNGDIYNDALGASIQMPNYALHDSSLAGVVPDVKNIALSEDGYKTSNGTYIGHVNVSYEPPSYPYLSSYDIYYRYNEGDWIYSGNSIDTKYTIENTQPSNVIEVKVVTVNTSGRKSVGSVSLQVYLEGHNSPPDDISKFVVGQYQDNLSFILEGNTPNDIDFDHIELRLDGDNWNSAERICSFNEFPYVLRNVSISDGTHVFRVKAVDNAGNESNNDTIFILTSRNPNTFKNVILERDDVETEEYTLKGLVKTVNGILVSQSTLRYDDVDIYDNTTTYDSQDDSIEILSSAIDTSKVGVTGVNFVFDISMYNTECTYDYLGDKTYDDIGNDTYDNIRSNSYKEVFMRFSDDNTTWTEWQPYVSADYTFRYIQYRIVFHPDNDNVRIEVRSLKQYYDVPDVEFSITTTTNNSGVATVSFEGSDFYYAPKQISCVILGASVPVYPIVSNVTTTGCTVTCYNTQGDLTKATFNLTVKGW